MASLILQCKSYRIFFIFSTFQNEGKNVVLSLFQLCQLIDLLMLIQEDDLNNFIQYTSQSHHLLSLTDENKDTLLHHATRYKRPNFALWLMQFTNEECQPDFKDHNGENSAQIAVGIDSIPMLRVLLDKNLRLINFPRNRRGSTLLHLAIELGFEEMAKYLCSTIEVDVNVKDYLNKKPDELDRVSKEVKRMIKNHR